MNEGQASLEPEEFRQHRLLGRTPHVGERKVRGIQAWGRVGSPEERQRDYVLPNAKDNTIHNSVVAPRARERNEGMTF